MAFHVLTARRRLTALALTLALGAPMLAPRLAHADVDRQDPDHCVGQAILKPLEPLTIATASGPAKFRVEVASTPIEHEYGLMCRKSLAPDRGMLFDFHVPSTDVAFWMRNTLIGLDIVYIRPDGTILSIARNARPLDETPIPAGGTIRAVLEIPAGRAAQLGLRPGDKVRHRIFGK